jgi:hypothetical protein
VEACTGRDFRSGSGNADQCDTMMFVVVGEEGEIVVRMRNPATEETEPCSVATRISVQSWTYDR